ncbi:aminomethyltransferase [Dethiosulfatibacter aminovorans DSM 17477]|uniref:Aminomethyltransferase n=1 Tax=Dethiosulfatibacter aminovorans DSM 17477 TaxID=1121476 RepID=A0A1M6ECT7_9FIRM|nr:aminomethyltransferase [Dethiosulfatibacter aminovorans DSM 17477]
MDKLKRTPLYESHLKLKGRMVEFGGWEMPVQYSGLVEEHNAVRNGVGIFDVSHMGEVEVRGKDAKRFVQHIITNDVDRIGKNEIQYAVMCYENGGVVDDTLVYKRDEDSYLIIINAGNIDKDVEWMERAISEMEFEVEFSHISHDTGEIALQGPKAEELLQKCVDFDLSALKFFNFAEDINIFGVSCLVSRSGYTGEDGFEIYASSGEIEKVWNGLLDKGREYNIHPCGLGARDTLRFEANLPLYGHELTEEISPLEAGYGFCVRLDKEEFIGMESLKLQRDLGLKRKVVGFELVDRGIARAGYEVLDEEGEIIGHVTTGYKSPTVGKSIGLALVDAGHLSIGSGFYIQIRKKRVGAKVISRKFLTKNYAR